MDRLNAVSVLLAVVEAGSFPAAARRLGTRLATISRRLSELEVRLKTRLLNRSSRQITRTDAERSYVEAYRQILEQVDEAEPAATGEYSAPKGQLAVSAPVVLGRTHLLPIALESLSGHPEIDLRLVLSGRILNLLEDDLDLAVRIGSLIATRIGPTATSSARARPSRTSSRRPGRSVWSTPASGCCR